MMHPGWGTEWHTPTLPAENPDEIKAERAMRHLKRRRRRILRGTLIAVGLPLAVVIAAVAWVGVDALHARGELKAAAAQVHVLQGQVEKGDRKAAAATLKTLQTYAASAQADTHGPHWSAVRVLPWIGHNVTSVQTVSEVIDGLALDALPALMDATSLVDPTTLAPVNGRVDLAPLEKAAPKVMAANAEVQTAVKRLDAINPDGLFKEVATPLTDLRTQVAKVASMSSDGITIAGTKSFNVMRDASSAAAWTVTLTEAGAYTLVDANTQGVVRGTQTVAVGAAPAAPVGSLSRTGFDPTGLLVGEGLLSSPARGSCCGQASQVLTGRSLIQTPPSDRPGSLRTGAGTLACSRVFQALTLSVGLLALAGCSSHPGIARPSPTSAKSSVSPSDPAVYAAQIVMGTNDVRRAQGLPEFVDSRCAQCCRAAAGPRP